MSTNIIIRTAKKDYVCERCNRIIRAGEEYLDKVTLNDGECVRHERYHDVCPKDSATERVFKKLFAYVEEHKEPLQVMDGDGCVHSVYGLEFFNGDWYVKVKYKDQPMRSFYLPEFVKDYRDENGDLL